MASYEAAFDTRKVERLNIRSSHIRVLRPLPSIKGCATFISTYLSTISSNVVSGIFSMLRNMVGKCKALAKVKPPLLMFLCVSAPQTHKVLRIDMRVSAADT